MSGSKGIHPCPLLSCSGQATGNIQPSASDRTNPTLHRTAAFTVVSQQGLSDEMLGKIPGCLQNRKEFARELGDSQDRRGLGGP